MCVYALQRMQTFFFTLAIRHSRAQGFISRAEASAGLPAQPLQPEQPIALGGGMQVSALGGPRDLSAPQNSIGQGKELGSSHVPLLCRSLIVKAAASKKVAAASRVFGSMRSSSKTFSICLTVIPALVFQPSHIPKLSFMRKSCP